MSAALSLLPKLGTILPPRTAGGFDLRWSAGARDAAAFVSASSAGGDLGTAPAPGVSAAPTADALFTLTAGGAVLTADVLRLTGVAVSALFSTSGSQAGVYTTGKHARSSISMGAQCIAL